MSSTAHHVVRSSTPDTAASPAPTADPAASALVRDRRPASSASGTARSPVARYRDRPCRDSPHKAVVVAAAPPAVTARGTRAFCQRFGPAGTGEGSPGAAPGAATAYGSGTSPGNRYAV